MPIPSTGPEVLKDIADYRGWETRDSQVDMAHAIDEASLNKRDVIVSAPVGVGKTGGYVSVAVARKKAVISTSTKALQDQVIEDLADLHSNAEELWGENFTYHVMKGKGSYVNVHLLRKFIRQSGETGGPLVDLLTDAEHAVEDATGEDFEKQLSAIPFKTRKLFTDDNGQSGDYQEWSTHAIAVDKAVNSDIIVVNTALLVSETMKPKSALLSGRENIIIDEAHHAPSIVRSAMSIPAPTKEALMVSNGDVKKAANKLASYETTAFDDDGDFLTKSKITRKTISGDSVSLSYAVKQMGDKSLDGLASKVDSFTNGLLATTSIVSGGESSTIPEYNLIRDSDKGMLLVPYITSVFKSKLARSCQLEEDLGSKISVSLCSGTIDKGHGLELGLYGADHISVPGPYHHARCKLFIPDSSDLDGAGRNSKTHDREAVEVAKKLCKESNGGALVLTTSNRMVEEYAAALQSAGYTVFSSSTMSKKEAVDSFKQDPNSVLVGTRSFWEGLDIPGRGLRLVIIDKIMFPIPNDPMAKTKMKYIKMSGGDTFNSVFVADAKTMMAQGVGRLIRSKNDAGVVAILDSRLRTGRYGGKVMSLVDPKMFMTPSIAEASKWLHKTQGLETKKLDKMKWEPLSAL